MARTPLSGIQHSIRAGDYEAVIASIGASLRSLTFGDRHLVVPFDADEVRPAYRGATLAPWPNRIVDAKYVFRGVAHQLPITEPARGHALHGLAAWLEFHAIDKGPSHVTLEAAVEAQAGYPWRAVVRVTYELTAEGLTQTVTATNDGAEALPWGTGPHPYLVAGTGSVDEWTLELPASQVLTVTDDRMLPLGLQAVDAEDAARFDFRTPRRVGAVELDHAFTDLAAEDGVTTVRVTAADGRGVAVKWDAACPWVQVYTADNPAVPSNPTRRKALAVEPMTCAPDAFNAAAHSFDTGLVVIEPGESSTAGWRIEAIG